MFDIEVVAELFYQRQCTIKNSDLSQFSATEEPNVYISACAALYNSTKEATFLKDARGSRIQPCPLLIGFLKSIMIQVF